nr:transglutaminase-like domain-containing protein [Spongiibacter thalassae]
MTAATIIFRQASTKESPSYTSTRTLQFSFSITNNSNEVVQNGTFRAYAPVNHTAIQHVDAITATHSYQTVTDDLGNTVLEFVLPVLAPYQTKVITVRSNLSVSEAPIAEALDDSRVYLQSEPLVETDHPALRELSQTLVVNGNGTDRDRARAVFEWVTTHLATEQYLPDDRGALWALQNRRGDCTEFMRLFMALVRLQGIPARGVSGYVVTGSQIVRPADFHNWVEIHLEGAWQIVDPQRHVFLTQQADYIATQIIQPVERNLLGRSHRYKVDGRLTAVMN